MFLGVRKIRIISPITFLLMMNSPSLIKLVKMLSILSRLHLKSSPSRVCPIYCKKLIIRCRILANNLVNKLFFKKWKEIKMYIMSIANKNKVTFLSPNAEGNSQKMFLLFWFPMANKILSNVLLLSANLCSLRRQKR